MSREHVCDDRCVCPYHGLPFVYSRATREHACQLPSCLYAHGISPVLERYRRGPHPPVGLRP